MGLVLHPVNAPKTCVRSSGGVKEKGRAQKTALSRAYGVPVVFRDKRLPPL